VTRRDGLTLGAAWGVTCALSMFHFATAGGPDEGKPISAGKIYVRADLKNGPGPVDLDRGIFTFDVKRAAWTKLTDFQGMVRVSRDGRTLALSRDEGDPEEERRDEAGVWTLAADGKGELRRIARVGGPASWSSDDKQLIVAKELSESPDGSKPWSFETWRVNADGSGSVKLPIPNTEQVEDWSPDGRWLATVSDRHPPHGMGMQIYLMRPDGTDQRRLTEGEGGNVHPLFSPEGRRVAYLHQERGINSLWVVNIDGTGRRRLFQEEDDLAMRHLCWLPDGHSVACMVFKWQRNTKGEKALLGSGPEGQDWRILVMDDAGKGRRVLKLPRTEWLGYCPDWR
jgi:hypothetical protein